MLISFIIVVLNRCAPLQYMKHDEPNIPEFELPPPQPSATYNISTDLFDNAQKLSDIEKVLSGALSSAKYARWSYYSVQDGFAIATQLERIDEFGNPFPDMERWNINSESYKIEKFSLSKYIRALFNASPGYYRCIVFVMSPRLFSYSSKSPSREEAYEWLDNGINRLPRSIGEKHLTKDHTLTAIIYEFKKLENSDNVNIIVPSRHDGRTHLETTNLLLYLNK